MDRVVLTFILHPEKRIEAPRVRANSWITLGLSEDLDEAAFLATEEMLMVMGELHGLAKREALGLASLLVDLRVTKW